MMQENEGKYVLYSEYAALEERTQQQESKESVAQIADEMLAYASYMSCINYKEAAQQIREWSRQLRELQ